MNQSLRSFWARWWPLAIGLASFAAMWAVVAYLGLHRTGGHVAYALDDAYIHMALAKNIALHGVWGATPFEFSSSSSSPLWTLLLAFTFLIFGVHDSTALVLTTLIYVALIVCADLALSKLSVKSVPRALALVWIVVATPMAPIVFGGMEHPLQLLIDLMLVCFAVRVLVSDSAAHPKSRLMIVVLSALACGVRYEGAVLVVVIAALLAFKRRWGLAFMALTAGALPVVAYGVFSIAHGAYFLPNSVLVKAATQTNFGLLLSSPPLFVSEFKRKLATAYPVYLLLAASIAFFVAQRLIRKTLWSVPSAFALISICVSAVHLTVGDVGWFFRYEDYMVMLLGVSLILQSWDVFSVREPRNAAQWAAVGLATALAVSSVLVCAHRGDVAFRSTPWAMKNVYDQQYQLAHFLLANPQYDSAVIGDLGAISYYNDRLRVTDLEGLALNGVPRSALGRDRIHPPLIRSLVRRSGAKIAIVFTDYFDQPAEWQLVGTWTIERDLVTYQPTVGFYAIPPTDAHALSRALAAYSSRSLPKDVHYRALLQ